jgi:hypothetical protein
MKREVMKHWQFLFVSLYSIRPQWEFCDPNNSGITPFDS